MNPVENNLAALRERLAAKRQAAVADAQAQGDTQNEKAMPSDAEGYLTDRWGQGWWGEGTPDVSNWPH